MSYEWQRTWWKHVGRRAPGVQLHVVVLTAGGQVVCIAPLFIHAGRAFGLVKLRRLAFVGTGLSDHLEVLVTPGLEDRCFERIASHLAERSATFDVISLADVPDPSATHAGLYEALRRKGFAGQRFVGEYCPRTQLADTWKGTLEGFDGSHRRQLAKRTRQLKERFRVELEITRREEDVARDVDAFIAMHQQRWTSVGKKGIYDAPHVAAFQREVAELFFRRGWLFLAFLRLDGARVVALCGFQHRNELAYYLNGVADAGDASRFSPGLVMHCLCMEELIARGVRVYDFLRGTERYKYECGAVDVPNWSLLMFRDGARLAKVRNALALLSEALLRRLEDERLAFLHQRRNHGLFSREVARHLMRRAAATLRDGTKKLRAPERALTVGKANRREGDR
jgi:CelD/BcsL family acetyltransferase involved in cellulose biosynthesis